MVYTPTLRQRSGLHTQGVGIISNKAYHVGPLNTTERKAGTEHYHLFPNFSQSRVKREGKRAELFLLSARSVIEVLGFRLQVAD